MWQNLIPRERKSITMFWVTSGIWGPNSKTVVFPHLWISSGELSKHVNEMPEGPCWIFDEARPLLKNSNSIPVFICCGYIHPTISSDVQDQSGRFSFFEAWSLFCVPVTSDIEMQASLWCIRVRNESHYLHEHTVIVQQSSTEKCNYATFNSCRAAVESSGDNFKCYACMSCKEFFFFALYYTIAAGVLLYDLSKSYFLRHFPSLKLSAFSSLLHYHLMILWKHIIKFFINTMDLSRVWTSFVHYGIGKCLSTLLSTHFNYMLTTSYGLCFSSMTRSANRIRADKIHIFQWHLLGFWRGEDYRKQHMKSW